MVNDYLYTCIVVICMLTDHRRHLSIRGYRCRCCRLPEIQGDQFGAYSTYGFFDFIFTFTLNTQNSAYECESESPACNARKAARWDSNGEKHNRSRRRLLEN